MDRNAGETVNLGDAVLNSGRDTLNALPRGDGEILERNSDWDADADTDWNSLGNERD